MIPARSADELFRWQEEERLKQEAKRRKDPRTPLQRESERLDNVRKNSAASTHPHQWDGTGPFGKRTCSRCGKAYSYRLRLTRCRA